MGGAGLTPWSQKIQPYVDDWDAALDAIHYQDRPFDYDEFMDYLHWYLPRTRTRVAYVPDVVPVDTEPVTQAYPMSRDYHYDMAVNQL